MIRRRRRPQRQPGHSAQVLFGGRLEHESGYSRHQGAWAKLTLRQMARALPRSLRKAVGLAWAADRVAVTVVLVAEIAEGIAAALGMLAANQAMVELFAAGPTPDRVRSSFPALTAIVIAAAVGQLLAGVSTVAAGRLEPKVERAADEELLCHVARVELTLLEDPEFSKLLDAARAGCDAARDMLGYAVGILGALIALVAAGGVLTILHPLLLPMLVLIVVPHAYGTLATSRRSYASMRTWLDHERQLDQISYLLTTQHTGQELRVHAAADDLIGKFRSLSDDSEHEQVRLAKATAATNLSAAAAGGVATGLTYGVLGWLLLSNRVPLSTAGTAVLAIRSGSGGLRTVVQQAAYLFSKTLWFDDFRHACAEAALHAVPIGGIPAPDPPELIEVHDVVFTYPGKDTPALDEVSVRIPRGSIIALVGENGSGKSTLAKLIAGVYGPDKGTVTWDGVDVASLDRADVYDKIGLVTQDFVHWPFTAGYNIRIGRTTPPGGASTPDENADGHADGHVKEHSEEHSEEHGEGYVEEHIDEHADGAYHFEGEAEFASAIAYSEADSLLTDLPRGWRTLVSRGFAGGVQLSGGQWQKLALARGAYRNAALLILDEPTAALDPAAEVAAYDKIRGLADAGHTAVLISHRMASTRRADRIFVLDRGRVVEAGSWDELMAARGRFRGMFDVQAREYSSSTDHAAAYSYIETPARSVPESETTPVPVPIPESETGSVPEPKPVPKPVPEPASEPDPLAHARTAAGDEAVS